MTIASATHAGNQIVCLQKTAPIRAAAQYASRLFRQRLWALSNAPEHEPQGKLPGQCADGARVPQLENGMDTDVDYRFIQEAQRDISSPRDNFRSKSCKYPLQLEYGKLHLAQRLVELFRRSLCISTYQLHTPARLDQLLSFNHTRSAFNSVSQLP